jgi:hypothetical protein
LALLRNANPTKNNQKFSLNLSIIYSHLDGQMCCPSKCEILSYC